MPETRFRVRAVQKGDTMATKLITGNAPRGHMPHIVPGEANAANEQADFREMAVTMLAASLGHNEAVQIQLISKVAFSIDVAKKMAAADAKNFDAKALRRDVLVAMAMQGRAIFRDVKTPAPDAQRSPAFVDDCLKQKGVYLLPSINSVFTLGIRTANLIAKQADKFTACFSAKTYNGVMTAYVTLAEPFAREAYNQIKAERKAKAEAAEKSTLAKATAYLEKAGLTLTDWQNLIAYVNRKATETQDEASAGLRIAALKAAQEADEAAAQEEMDEAA